MGVEYEIGDWRWDENGWEVEIGMGHRWNMRWDGRFKLIRMRWDEME
jgi:hypothetical protein